MAHAESADLLRSDNNDDTDATSQTQEERIRYQLVLKKTTNQAILVMIVCLLAQLAASGAYYVMEIYMQSLPGNPTKSSVSTLIFIAFFLSAIESYIAGWLGDRYGHDKALLFVFVIDGIGVCLEVATHIAVFSIGLFLTGFSIELMCLAYFAYTLPHKHAVFFISVYVSLFYIVSVLGAILASFIVDHSSYRSVFWFQACVYVACILVNLVFVLGSQHKLQSLQRALSETFVHRQEHDDIFPVCLVHVQDNEHPVVDSSWTAFFHDIGKTELILLIIATVQNGISSLSETVFLVYFAEFVMKQFVTMHLSLGYTSAMFSLIGLGVGLSAIFLPKMVSHIIPHHVYVVVVGAFILFVSSILLMIDPPNIVLLWVLLLPGIGLPYGAVHIGSEMCVLEMQPKHHSGKVFGIKEALKVSARAFALLFVGRLWKVTHYDSFCIVNAFAAFVVLISSPFLWWFGKQLKRESSV